MGIPLTVRRWWPLVAIFLVSVGLRWLTLGSQALFTDEAVSWVTAQLSPREIVGVSTYNHHVPLYFFLLKLSLQVLPATEAGARTLSAIASTVALVVVLAFVQSEWGLVAAVYAGILMALSSFDLYYAQETRMYTVLALVWIVSYVSLVKALQGRGSWLVVWAIAMIAMPWTHLYGFLVVGTNIAFVAGYLILKRLHRVASSVPDRWLVLAVAVVIVGIVPAARILLTFSDTTAMGALESQVTDLRDLYLIWSVGLVTVRHLFVDPAHLTLPATESVSPALWFVAGTVICGGPAIYGLARGLRMNGSRRLQAVLAIINIVLPVAIAFGYAEVMETRIWIQRPFLGAAYLVYLWAGIGFAAIRWRRSRWVLALLAVVVALATLVPYFSMWEKSNSRQAFTSMPQPAGRNVLVLQMPFLASQARFYLGLDVPLMALTYDRDDNATLVRLRFDEGFSFARIMGRTQDVTCEEFSTITDVWLYGYLHKLGKVLPMMVSCAAEARFWLFEGGRWKQLDRTPYGARRPIPMGMMDREASVSSWLIPFCPRYG